ncbi:hypothetical protein D9613_001430 [Agrocybe pediades]|uniref:F-box domain-containing protein n=1 Tax=Agrocybe pediades TaxID=84607 RepID=A0A8H4VXD9_9AGAR|nr:hypothetical protein D9613_001430 [Agrocybe pediades]
MDSNLRRNCVKEVPNDVPSAHSPLLCPNGDVGPGCFECRETGSLEREADEISKKLENILTKLANARSATNHSHSTILVKLPNEILSHIFCAAWDAIDPSPPKCPFGYEEPQEEKKMSIALLLAGVCRKWRAIALSLPRIWSDIHVFIHRQKGDKALSILRNIIARSKHAHLTLRLYSEPLDCMDRIIKLQPALSILQTESQRWRSLQMCLPYELVRAFFEPNMDLSRVDLLYVHSNEHDYMGLSDPLWKDKGLRPQRLSLYSPAMRNIDLSWDRVTHVVAIDFDTDQVMKVIRSAPLLATLELIEMDEVTEVTGIYSRNFVHANLQHLIYYAGDNCTDGSTESIFYWNVFPALKTVDYHTLFKTDDDSFFEHLVRNKPPIQELKLHGSPYDSPYVVRALRAIGSTLNRLDFEPYEEFQDNFEYDDIFTRLAEVNSSPPSSDPSDLDVDKQMFLPRLEYLRFTTGWIFPWERVPAFFGSPSDPYRRPLKEFIFNTWVDFIIPKEDLLPLIDLRNAGFVVESEGATKVIQTSLKFYGLPTST